VQEKDAVVSRLSAIGFLLLLSDLQTFVPFRWSFSFEKLFVWIVLAFVVLWLLEFLYFIVSFAFYCSFTTLWLLWTRSVVSEFYDLPSRG
jgi:hypothetical protein